MFTILLSTTNFHNCGDDFIREGLMNLLSLNDQINIIWWNRGPGIQNKFQNDLRINLSAIDYFILAGTPEWVSRNENIYKYCLKHDIPVSLIGVGSHGGLVSRTQQKLMQKVAQSGLCEILLTRDERARQTLENVGFKDIEQILDPAFFNNPITHTGQRKNLLTWRNLNYNYISAYLSLQLHSFYQRPVPFIKRKVSLFLKKRNKNQLKKKYDTYMQDLFSKMKTPKQIIIHENNEIHEAQQLFGNENVFYSSDYQVLYRNYASARVNVGSRIHGAIPAFIHGAPVTLIYDHKKAGVLETAKSIFTRYNPEVANTLRTTYITQGLPVILDKPSDHKDEICQIIKKEKKRTQLLIKSSNVLGSLMGISE